MEGAVAERIQGAKIHHHHQETPSAAVIRRLC
jgi:hypothetical protein